MGTLAQAKSNQQQTAQKAVRVLLLEDNDVDVLWVERGLKGRKYNVAVVKDVQSVDMFLSRQPVDVIVLDLNLPDSNGIGTVKQIANSRPGTPIVVLSGQGDFDTVRNALLAGAQTFQVKDIGSQETLAERIDFAIERKYREIELAKKHIAAPL
jgi:DNA-binding NtrC family response regulator